MNKAQEKQGSAETTEMGTEGNSSASTRILCDICHEAGSGDMIQCDTTEVSLFSASWVANVP